MATIGFSNRTKMAARLAVIAAIGAAMLSACGDKDKEGPTSPTSTTTTTTSAPASSSAPAAPTEKGGPSKDGNKFSPTVVAPRPNTALPGNVITAPH